jgi:hypothetical protein
MFKFMAFHSSGKKDSSHLRCDAIYICYTYCSFGGNFCLHLQNQRYPKDSSINFAEDNLSCL